MQRAYIALHKLGVAHSVETWLGEELVGGLYGISLGGMFAGESMFCTATDASKAAFVSMAQQLHRWGFTLIDGQLRTDHLASLGAFELPRGAYLAQLDAALACPTRRGPWSFDEPGR